MSNRLENSKLRTRTAEAIGRRTDPEFMRYCKELDSGYTYIGQLISHEITPITDPYRATRKVTGTMDLQSIYGSRENYRLQHISKDDLLFTSDGCFKFSSEAKLDFQRNAKGVAVIPEGRNDDHVIIAQMHMFWQRLHNLFIRQGFATDAMEAKKLVVLTFQMMVTEDYLRQVHDKSVYRHMIGKNRDFLTENGSLWQDVFRFATFRFGHSTIRDSYTLRMAEDDPMSSKDLDQLFMHGRKPRRLEEDDYIDWRAFFCQEDQDLFEGLMPVDTRISGFMAQMPTRHGIGAHIASRNMASELAANLPCGIEIAKTIEQVLPSSIKKHFKLLTTEHIEEAAFSHLDLEIDDLTIWLYMLLEAQIEKDPHKLGVMGSSVNIHVIKAAIKQADFSIYQHGFYDFDQVVSKLGHWGEVLKSFSKTNEKNEKCKNGKIRMKDLVKYLTDKE